jgi:hypothetical protein
MSKATQVFSYFPAAIAVFLALFAPQCKYRHIEAPQTPCSSVVLPVQGKRVGAAND